MNLTLVQTKMKKWYDKNDKQCHFRVGDKVVLLPLQNYSLQARCFGPYLVAKKVSEVDHIVNTLDKCKAQYLCQANMIKPLLC